MTRQIVSLTRKIPSRAWRSRNLATRTASRSLSAWRFARQASRLPWAAVALGAIWPGLVSLPLFGLIQKLPLPSNARFNRAVARLDTLVYRIIAERQRDPAES